MKKIMRFLKRNSKEIIFYILFFIAMIWEFPYYIDAPGGIININDRVEIANNYKSTGSFNLAYVSEYRATIPSLIYSFFDNDWKVYKKSDVLYEDESYSDLKKSDRLLLEEAYSNAVYVGYSKAKKEVTVEEEKVYVSGISDLADTNLQINDQFVEVDGKKVNNKQEIDAIVQSFNPGDTINIKVKNNGKEVIRSATLIEYENKTVIGISVIKIKKLKTNPEVIMDYKKDESGPSGGLMLTLAIYNNLVSEDITKGLTIVGTGTIDDEGVVGEIGGIDYKLKSAVKNDADIFIVPNGDNYKDAMSLKNKNNYEIEIVGVSTFDEALEYLKNRE